MRRFTLVLALATVTLLLGFGSAASAQTASTLPGVPVGQGGPDNGVNATQGGNAPGGANDPAVNAGPATDTGDDASLAPWLIGAALLALLVAGGALMARKSGGPRRSDTYSGRTA